MYQNPFWPGGVKFPRGFSSGAPFFRTLEGEKNLGGALKEALGSQLSPLERFLPGIKTRPFPSQIPEDFVVKGLALRPLPWALTIPGLGLFFVNFPQDHPGLKKVGRGGFLEFLIPWLNRRDLKKVWPHFFGGPFWVLTHLWGGPF